MSLIGSLFAGVTGLSSNSQAMEIIGDNIANVNTVGFKQSRGVFSDTFSNILSNGSSFSQVGRGATLNGVIQSFSQGSLEASPNALDLAIDGSGFFIVNNGNGNYYTRNGQLRMNQNGVVQAITGETLQGYEITNSVTSSSLTDVDLAGVQSALGHSSIMLTIDTYSHVMPGLEEAAARRIDDILGDAVAGNS